MFVLDEIHVRGDKIIYDNVLVEYVKPNIPKDHPRLLEEGPKVGPKTSQGLLQTDGNRRSVGQSTPHS